jgi:hypothetical protein
LGVYQHLREAKKNPTVLSIVLFLLHFLNLGGGISRKNDSIASILPLFIFPFYHKSSPEIKRMIVSFIGIIRMSLLYELSRAVRDSATILVATSKQVYNVQATVTAYIQQHYIIAKQSERASSHLLLLFTQLLGLTVRNRLTNLYILVGIN